MTAVDILRALAMPVWITLALMFAPAVWRVIRHRPRDLDLLWLGGFLLATNRVAFQVNGMTGGSEAMRIWCQASALVAALAWLVIVRRYQRHDW